MTVKVHSYFEVDFNTFCYRQKRTIFFFCLFFFFFFAISWAVPTAYGGSQARGQIGATGASLHNSHSNGGSKPHL